MKDKNFSQWRKQLDLFQDDDQVWRGGGRIQNTSVSFSSPAASNPFYDYLVCLRRSHGLRQPWLNWDPKFGMRSFVKSILGQCTICKKFQCQPYRALLPPPLPTFRVEESPPFASAGVDFAGPLYVKKVDSTIRKVCMCLFTCCVTRAVHLDLVADSHVSPMFEEVCST